tara:strand:+ start:164 stop:370 length:207 start_codon:yes stop_codon:yes gene_type:complete
MPRKNGPVMDKDGKDEMEQMDSDAFGLSGLRVLESTVLFGERNEICIRHDGALYRLKITRQGKLILNK